MKGCRIAAGTLPLGDGVSVPSPLFYTNYNADSRGMEFKLTALFNQLSKLGGASLLDK
jgi:hypothetical protein